MKKDIKQNVREAYGKIAQEGSSCCSSSSSCCGDSNSAESASQLVGYTEEELKSVPEGADLGLGCGNPVALASLKEGETVLDLGSGPGMDCFLSSIRVGKKGKVIGVDMTPEMLERARANAQKGHYQNVEFRLGEIENLPLADNSVDVVISNCVINLSSDKKRVFQESYRVLKPGGRLMVSDIVLEKALPENLKNSNEAYCSCIAGAVLKNKYLQIIRNANFEDIKIVGESTSYIHPEDYQVEDENKGGKDCCNSNTEDITVTSIKVSAIKPL